MRIGLASQLASVVVAYERISLMGLGAEGRNRTVDTGFFRPVLYQLSYLGPGG